MRNAARAEKGIKGIDTLQPQKNNSNESDCSPYIIVNGDLRRIFKCFINGHVKIQKYSNCRPSVCVRNDLGGPIANQTAS